MDGPHLAATDSNLRQPSPSPDPSAPGAGASRRRPPKLRRRQPQASGDPQPPPDTAMPLTDPAENSLSTQRREWGDSHVHVKDAEPDDEHGREHGRGKAQLNLNSHSTDPSSEPAPSSEAEDTSSLGTGPTPALAPAPAPAQNTRQQIVLDRTQDGEGRESQQLMQIDDLGNSSGEMVRDVQTKTVGTVNGAREGVIGSITRHGHERLQDQRTGSNEQLKLRLDLNLDLEVQLKAKIRGDLTLQLMYVFFRL
ncbi:hypothetical protein BDV10DRAFT_188748 [Aspergillus recurvatus]